jgi:hypothetical protein
MFAVLANVQAEDLTSDLILHYKFDGNTANVAGGASGAGTLQNSAALTTGNAGYEGEAIYLSTPDKTGDQVDYLQLPADIPLYDTDFTVAEWVKLTDNPTGAPVNYFSIGFDGGKGVTVQSRWDGKIHFHINNNTAPGAIASSSAVLPVDEWIHIAITAKYTAGSETGVGTLYINGVAVATATELPKINVASASEISNNYIGRAYWNDPGMKGYVDDFRIYTRALSAYDIAKLYVGEGKAFSRQYPFTGSDAEITYYPVTTRYRTDFRDLFLYKSETGFALSNATKDVTVTWTKNPANDIMIIAYEFDYSYTDGEDVHTGTITDEKNAAVFGNALSGTYDLYSSGTQNDGNDDLSITEILEIDPNAAITIKKIRINDLWHGAQDYQIASLVIAGENRNELYLDGWSRVNFYSGEFTATEEGRQAFRIDRFEIPADMKSKYVRLDLSEATADNWGFNLDFSKLKEGTSDEYDGVNGGWSDLINAYKKIGNSYYYQIPAEAEYVHPQLYKNSTGETKTIKVAGFFLTDQIGDDFIIPANGSKTATEYQSGVYGDIIFNDGSQLTGIESGGLTVNGVVKYNKTISAKKWYPIGFPFAIDGVYCTELKDGALDASISGTDGDYWLKAYSDNESSYSFIYTQSYTPGTGYIVEFPTVFINKVVTFVSTAAPVLYNTNTPVTEIAAGYSMLANPSVANITHTEGISGAHNHYVHELKASNNFGLVDATYNTYTVKPFESLIVAKSVSVLRSSFGTEETNAPTGIETELSNDPVIEQRYYNLQGIEIAKPVQYGVYIVKKIHVSQRTETVKVIYKH